MFLALAVSLASPFAAFAQESQTPPLPDPAALGAAPVAAAPPQAEKPLLIIRFNATYVHYQNSLILAVNKAKEANPKVKFRVVAHMPYGSSRLESQRISEKAKSTLATIAQQLTDLGIAPSQISLSAQADESLLYHEIYIFVD